MPRWLLSGRDLNANILRGVRAEAELAETAAAFEAVRTALMRLLLAYAFNPQAYGSAREFIKSLNDEVPDCAIVDVFMPEMDGIELQHTLHLAGFTIPTIAITASDTIRVREQCIAAGAAAYLVKPLPDDSLIAAINKLVADRTSHAEK